MADALSAATVEAILTGECPQLEQLALGFVYEQPADPEAIDTFVAIAGSGTSLPVERLHLACDDRSEEMLEGLAGSALVEQLELLCIHSTGYEDLVPVALRLSEGLADLDVFGLSLDGQLEFPHEELEELMDAVPGLVDSDDEAFDVFSSSAYRSR